MHYVEGCIGAHCFLASRLLLAGERVVLDNTPCRQGWYRRRCEQVLLEHKRGVAMKMRCILILCLLALLFSGSSRWYGTLPLVLIRLLSFVTSVLLVLLVSNSSPYQETP